MSYSEQVAQIADMVPTNTKLGSVQTDRIRLHWQQVEDCLPGSDRRAEVTRILSDAESDRTRLREALMRLSVWLEGYEYAAEVVSAGYSLRGT